MSNISLNIFIVLLFVKTIGFGQVPITQDVLLKEGDRDFDYGLYEQAKSSYTQVFENGYMSPTLLYRLAYIHEQLEEYPESIFYLRKLEWETGDPMTANKIRNILTTHNTGWIMSGENHSPYRLGVQRLLPWIWIGFASSMILAIIGIFLIKKRGINITGLFLGIVSLILSLILLEHYILRKEKAVLITPTLFYESPGYTAPRTQLPIPLGTTLSIEEQSDVWYKIHTDRYTYWVPSDKLKKL